MSTPGDADHPQQDPGLPPQDPAEPRDPGSSQGTGGTTGQPGYGQPQDPYAGQYAQGPYAQGQYPQDPYAQGPYAPPQQGPYGYPPRPVDERFWAPATHWGALVVWLVTSGVLAFVVPLVIMQTKGNESPVVRRHAVASLNFQLSMLIYAAVSGILVLVGAVLSFILIGIPVLVLALVALLAVVVVAFVMPILAAVKANNGEEYTYPFTMKLFS